MTESHPNAQIIDTPTTTAGGGKGEKFLDALCRYYRDFLESDFKRQRLPKRSLTNKDRAGNLTGIPVRKYASFREEIWRKLNELIVSDGVDFTVARGRYRAHITKGVIDRYGRFLGCSRYPRCRGTRQI